jgi:hypothetical protein
VLVVPVPSPEEVLTVVEDAYRRQWPGEPERACVAFLGIEAIEILRFDDGLGETYLSLGMARSPMTEPAAARLASASGPRAELMLSTVGRPDGVWRQLAVLAAAPVVESVVYRRGDRVDLDAPLIDGSRCTGAVLVDGGFAPITATAQCTVDILQVLPATADELAWARVYGTDALVDLWAAHGCPLGDLLRPPVKLP